MRIFFGDSTLPAGRDPDRQDYQGPDRAYPWPIFVALFFSRSETLERRLFPGDRLSDRRGWALRGGHGRAPDRVGVLGTSLEHGGAQFDFGFHSAKPFRLACLNLGAQIQARSAELRYMRWIVRDAPAPQRPEYRGKAPSYGHNRDLPATSHRDAQTPERQRVVSILLTHHVPCRLDEQRA